MNNEPPQPASETKHLSILHHPIPGSSIIVPLRQLSSSTIDGNSTGTTGTTLWLSSQLLALYISSLPPPAQIRLKYTDNGNGGDYNRNRDQGRGPYDEGKIERQRVLDLGSGIGYLPLCLAQMGYDALATDVPSVIDSVLKHNITSGLDAIRRPNPTNPGALHSLGNVEVVTLDWETVSHTGLLPDNIVNERPHILTTSDTIYAPHLLFPLFETLRFLSMKTRPTVYISLERRDSELVDRALKRAGEMGLVLRRIDAVKIGKLMDSSGWMKEGWDDVEIWKGKFTRSSLGSLPAPPTP